MTTLTFGILTISDSSSQANQYDKSGPLLVNLVSNSKFNGKVRKVQLLCRQIVPDNMVMIMNTLKKWSDVIGVNVILTTGGTGFAPKDVTPEATKNVIDKEAPSLCLAMFLKSIKITPLAMLSRSVCGIRKNTLIVNLPGSPKAVQECFSAIEEAIPHAVNLILDSKIEVQSQHDEMQSKLLTSCPCCYKFNVTSRDRESPFPMISYQEALKIIRTTISNNEILTETANTANVSYIYGKILAEAVYSNLYLPPFRASIKDGYAVLASDGKGKRQVLCGVKAGATNIEKIKISPGYCVRINTGAPVPDDATAVVQVEDTKLLKTSNDEKEESVIEILVKPTDGQDIRPIGIDVKKGEKVLDSGTKLGPIEIGILASCGCSEISIVKSPTIGVLSTGNELQVVGETLQPGHIYDSNKWTLITLLKENNYEALDFGITWDMEQPMIETLKKCLLQTDVLVTTGSVSMGDGDLLKPILKKVFDATIHFGRVNLKPGKPTTYATCTYEGKKKYIMCLPGNPVSATVTTHLFLLPLLNHLTKNQTKPIIVKAEVTENYLLDARPEFVRVTLKWDENHPYPRAYSTGNQISSKLLSCKNANALLMLPEKSENQKDVKIGEIVLAMLLGFNQ